MAFEPTWGSVSAHIVPDWFHDAKVGIFIHWACTRSLPGRHRPANWAR